MYRKLFRQSIWLNSSCPLTAFPLKYSRTITEKKMYSFPTLFFWDVCPNFANHFTETLTTIVHNTTSSPQLLPPECLVLLLGSSANLTGETFLSDNAAMAHLFSPPQRRVWHSLALTLSVVGVLRDERVQRRWNARQSYLDIKRLKLYKVRCTCRWTRLLYNNLKCL